MGCVRKVFRAECQPEDGNVLGILGKLKEPALGKQRDRVGSRRRCREEVGAQALTGVAGNWV